MMNYDGLLSQLTDEKLNICQGQAGAGAAAVNVSVNTVEEEQAAAIRTVPRVAKSEAAATTAAAATTPQRKISTSSRFMNAFQQFYTGGSSSSGGVVPAAANENDELEGVIASNVSARAPPPPPQKVGVEAKLLSMWHNVKYGWSGKLKSNFSKEQPVWLLGRCYHRKSTPPGSMETSAELNANMLLTLVAPTPAANAYEEDQEAAALQSQFALAPNASSLYPPLLNPLQVDEIVVPQELGMDAAADNQQIAENPWEEGIEGFRRDFYSRIWMTYRREFPTMNGSNYTSDCGWGCMLRSGQMLLAQGLICHFLSRSWRYDAETQLHSTYEDNMHKKIIKWFGDSSSKSSPFSIHALVSLGEERGKKPGDWYGPASVSFLLKQALKNAAQENADFDNIAIYVAKDCTIYIQDVETECCIPEPTPKPIVPWQTTPRKIDAAPKPEKQHWKSLIVLIPLRLGTEKLNPVYAHCLKLLLSTEYCIGIIGGRPKHSLYFVGFQEDKLIHLDPHYCQEMVDVNQENFSLASFHCKSPRKLKTAKLDPSCCIGFYCQTKTDFDNFVESVQLYLHPMRCASGNIEKFSTPSAPQQQLPGGAAAPNTELGATQYAEINYPLFTFSRGRCLDHEQRDEMSDSLYKPLQRQLEQMSSELLASVGSGTVQSANTAAAAGAAGIYAFDDDDDGETEEFVLL